MGAPGGASFIWPVPPRLLVLTKMYPSLGSNETPPQFPPPMVPGIISEAVIPNGVYGP